MPDKLRRRKKVHREARPKLKKIAKKQAKKQALGAVVDKQRRRKKVLREVKPKKRAR